MGYYDNVLEHHGILGQKWGIRRFQNKDGSLTAKGKKRYDESETKEKRHLGIDKRGNINLIKGKTTKEAKTAFAIKSSLFTAGIALTAYIAKHPKTIEKGQKVVENLLKKNGSLNVKTVSDSGIYSKSLGRMMTIGEAIEAGLI